MGRVNLTRLEKYRKRRFHEEARTDFVPREVRRHYKKCGKRHYITGEIEGRYVYEVCTKCGERLYKYRRSRG